MSADEFRKLPDLQLDFWVIERHRLREEGAHLGEVPFVPSFRCGRRCYLLEQETGVFVMLFNPDMVDVVKCVHSLRCVIVPLECWTLEDDKVVDFRLVG